MTDEIKRLIKELPTSCMTGLEVAQELQRILDSAESFDQVWERTGYQYGEDALEQVKLGWELARGCATL